MEKIDITIIGAGVVGLAVAQTLAQQFQDVFVLERHDSFGRETSSRNSEVIHAGIYYPKDSLKQKTCCEGKRLLYEFCAKHHIPHRRIGKLIVAIEQNELPELEALFKNGLANCVDDLKLLSASEIKSLEPHIQAQAAILSPGTGILDTHQYMKTLAAGFESRGGQISYNTEVIAIEKTAGGYKITVKDTKGETFDFLSRLVINSAGLDADKVAQLAGISKKEYQLKYCKGDYCRVNQSKAGLIKRLIYPVPKKDRAGLGIHATLDLAGGMRLGPDDEYISKIDYTVKEEKAKLFYASVRSFLPFLESKDVTPDMTGIRPKLQGHGEPFRDFIIKEESSENLPGFINLIGIESPGLTGSLAIANMVKEIVGKIS